MSLLALRGEGRRARSGPVICGLLSRRHNLGGGLAAAFNACISQTQFLVRVRHGSGNKAIEMIKGRAHGAVVAEFAGLPSVRAAEALPTPFGGSGAGAENGRYGLFTTTALDPDATMIERCWDRVFPLAP